MSKHKWILRLAVTASMCVAATVQSQVPIFEEPLSPRIANYTIEVSLDTDAKLLRGKQVLTWRNTSTVPASELQFHLYLNAFRNSKSTYMRESGLWATANRIPDSRWGYIDITRMTLADGADLLPRMTFIQPDDDNIHDKTVARIELPEPVRPKKSIRLEMEFTAKLPEPAFRRTGALKEYFFVGQWFPKFGVFADGRWNCHQFHANSEFFADFGVYDVRITVPESHIVGATGVQIALENNTDGTATHHYYAEDIHDFAWTSSPAFVETRDQFRDIDIRLLMQPDHLDQTARHLDAARFAIESYEEWYGDYPYPNLTIVDPRRGAIRTGRMEYPTLFTVGTNYGVPDGVRFLEFVITHEFGHNYWYNMLASNEFEESWLDEGINSFVEIQIMRERYGPQGDLMDFMGFELDHLEFHRAQFLFGAGLDGSARNAWEFYSGLSYNANTYSRPALVLETLQNYLGREKMQAILRTYVQRFRFKHPVSSDFIQVANEVAGEDLGWFFEQGIHSDAVLDYSVDRVFSFPIPSARGYDWSLTTPTGSTGRAAPAGGENAESATSGPAAAQDAVVAGSEKQLYDSGVYIRRLGSFQFPVDVVARFSDGTEVRERWDGKAGWKKFRFVRDARLVSAEVDPERKVPLDINFANNSQALAPPSLGLNTFSSRMMFWMQFLLDDIDFLNLLSGPIGPS